MWISSSYEVNLTLLFQKAEVSWGNPALPWRLGTYNPMISACAESQGWEEAVTIFDEMMANEVAPDIKSAWAAHGDTSQSPVGFG